jgi:hypothetical protein
MDHLYPTGMQQVVPELGRKLVCDIDARDMARYQQKRIDAEASPKTVNLEIGTLRAILKRFGQWARLQPNVNMLATRDDIGRAITPEEETVLLQACGKSRSPLLFHSSLWRLKPGRGTAQFGRCNGATWTLKTAACNGVRTRRLPERGAWFP